jgi:hypothetical protein
MQQGRGKRNSLRSLGGREREEFVRGMDVQVLRKVRAELGLTGAIPIGQHSADWQGLFALFNPQLKVYSDCLPAM